MIHSAALDLLENVGVAIHSVKALDLLKEAGVDIDFKKKMARPTLTVIEEAMKKSPKEFALGAFFGEGSLFGRIFDWYSN